MTMRVSSALRRSKRPAAHLHTALIAIAVMVVCAVAAGPASARSILVVAPHPDDETLIAAGVIRQAVEAGDTVTVVVVTNGDRRGTAVGYTRQAETVAAMSLLGLAEDDVIFLGHGDELLMTLYNAASETTVSTSTGGQTRTYGNRGLGRTDYHTYRYGVAGDYNRRTVLQDLTDLLVTFAPDDIYTTSYHDAHYDHKAVHLFLVEALVTLKRQGADVRGRLHESFVHAPCPPCNPWVGDPTWPAPGFAPAAPFAEPQYLATTPLRWTRAERRPVPPAMQDPVQATNLKYQVLARYPSHPVSSSLSFVRKDEFAWVTDFAVDLTPTATVTASSENLAAQQVARKAVDGIVAGAPRDARREWATVGQLAGAWIRLTWDSPVIVSAVSLHDRPSPTDNVQAGRLLFSDGGVLSVGSLPPDGAELALTFAPRVVTWVEFRVDGAVGTSIGLAEIRVIGKPAASSDNHSPILFGGPTATSAAISDGETVSLSVQALDVDGDPLVFAWSAESGVIEGSGPTVTFAPVRVSTETFVAVTVTVSDGRGGAVGNATFVKVGPAPETAVLRAFTVAESIVGSGQSTQGTVALSTAAPDGGLPVALGTAGTPAITIPATVTVPGGATTASFTITGGPVTAMTLVSLSASVTGVVKSAAVTVVPNLAGQAAVSVSSQNVSTRQLGVKAVDGIVDGWPGDHTREWATLWQRAGAWIRLTWTAPVAVSEVGLHDRPNATDNIRGGRLLFSDGSVVAVGALPPGGAERRVAFVARTVTWVELRIDDAVGLNIGLAEFRVFMKAASVPVAPNLASRAQVTVSSENVSTQQLGIKATDGVVDGWPGDYTKEWATLWQRAGAWIRLTWTAPVTASRVGLYDRRNTTDNVLGGRLLFSDGSVVGVGALPPAGGELGVTFPSRTVTWIEFRVDQAAGLNVGLAEFRVFPE
jgi:LmbE family N-acetylglucosaminyl deacetylase